MEVYVVCSQWPKRSWFGLKRGWGPKEVLNVYADPVSATAFVTDEVYGRARYTIEPKPLLSGHKLRGEIAREMLSYEGKVLLGLPDERTWPHGGER